MVIHRIVEAADIAASPAEVYALLRDYRVGHPGILPPAFRNLEVLEGGVGEGTLFRCEMRLLGRTTVFHGRVTEPRPGTRLVETDPHTGLTTIFHLAPTESGTRLTFITEMPVKAGLLGWIQGWVITRLLTPVFRQELRLIQERLAER